MVPMRIKSHRCQQYNFLGTLVSTSSAACIQDRNVIMIHEIPIFCGSKTVGCFVRQLVGRIGIAFGYASVDFLGFVLCSWAALQPRFNWRGVFQRIGVFAVPSKEQPVLVTETHSDYCLIQRENEVPRVLFLGVCLDFYYFLARVALAKF